MDEIWFIGLGFFIMGIVFAVIGNHARQLQADLDNRQIAEAMAVVTKSDLERHDMGVGTDTHRSRLYTPTVKFIDVRGNEHEVKASYSCYPEKFHVGDRIKIRYDLTDPKSIELEGEGHLYQIAFWLFTGIGFLFAIIGGSLLIYACFI